jgi:fermentation-respiration switch protein FrsA (DUF1100 family)
MKDMFKNVILDSNGLKISANLYSPQKDGKVPGIVMCHGFAGVKEFLIPIFAKRFADYGCMVLTFDYRGFGESDGERGFLNPGLQIEDILKAMSYLRSHPQVDENRIALWGTSFGGANAIYAAEQDGNVQCLIVQLPFGDGQRVVTRGMSDDEITNFYTFIEKMETRKKRTGKEMMVPINKVLTDPQSKQFYNENVDEFPALKIKIPMLTVAETIKHKPERIVGNLPNTPILIVAAGKDCVNPVEESEKLFEKANEPKELFVIDEATHYEIYAGEFFEQAIGKQLSWIEKYL